MVLITPTALTVTTYLNTHYCRTCNALTEPVLDRKKKKKKKEPTFTSNENFTTGWVEANGCQRPRVCLADHILLFHRHDAIFLLFSTLRLGFVRLFQTGCVVRYQLQWHVSALLFPSLCRHCCISWQQRMISQSFRFLTGHAASFSLVPLTSFSYQASLRHMGNSFSFF